MVFFLLYLGMLPAAELTLKFIPADE